MDEPSLRRLLSTGPWRHRARWALRLVTPWGIEWWLWKGNVRKVRRRIKAAVVREVPTRDSRVGTIVEFLVGRGLDESEVREGSMPDAALRYLDETVRDRLPRGRPVRVLHLGNFVGVSLCYLSWLARERHPESLVVSIDPNVPHRGIENPQSHVLALLDHFDLLRRNLIITGYTLERSEEATRETDHLLGVAPDNVLVALEDLAGASFDLVLIDGNHEESYLARELDALARLVTDGGIVAFDDIKDWPGVRSVFSKAAQSDGWMQLGEDRRVGILQRRVPGQTEDGAPAISRATATAS